MTVRGRLGTSVVLINAGNNLGGESGQIAFFFWKKSQMGGSRSSRPVPMGVVSGPQVSTVAAYNRALFFAVGASARTARILRPPPAHRHAHCGSGMVGWSGRAHSRPSRSTARSISEATSAHPVPVGVLKGWSRSPTIGAKIMPSRDSGHFTDGSLSLDSAHVGWIGGDGSLGATSRHSALQPKKAYSPPRRRSRATR
jgi:hypothetical protein